MSLKVIKSRKPKKVNRKSKSQKPVKKSQKPVKKSRKRVKKSRKPKKTSRKPVKKSRKPVKKSRKPKKVNRKPKKTSRKPKKTVPAANKKQPKKVRKYMVERFGETIIPSLIKLKDIDQRILIEADKKYSEVKQLYGELYQKFEKIGREAIDSKKIIGFSEVEPIPNSSQVEKYERTRKQYDTSWEDPVGILTDADVLIEKLKKMLGNTDYEAYYKDEVLLWDAYKYYYDAKVLLWDAYKYLSRFGEMTL